MERWEGRAAVYNAVLNNLQVAEEEARHPARRFLQHADPFLLEDNKFIKMFRLNKHQVRYLMDMLGEYLRHPTRASAISVEQKVLVALRFYATGSYQEIVGSNIFLGISQPSTSRCIKEVTDALNEPNIMNFWIKFPSTMQEMETVRTRFYQKHQLPGVIGVIDCTHIAILTPSGNEYPENIYVNRKNYHSINVQLICDEKLEIMNVDARFPGSCNDIHIWNQSQVAPVMEQIYRRNPNNLCYLLGDSGYTLRPWLLTPFDSPPVTAAEQRFDQKLKVVRSTIERCNGVLKNRFRCLLKDRVLHYSPQCASKIINACVVLHNMCIQANLGDPVLEDDPQNVDYGIYQDEIAPQAATVNPDLARARELQRQIAATHFTN